jgi:hypothetical protein
VLSVLKSGSFNLLEPSGPVMGLLYHFTCHEGIVEIEVQLHLFLISTKIKASGQAHNLTDFPRLPVEQETGWVPQQVFMF